MLAQEYGWTPSEIDALSWKTIQGLLVLLQSSAARRQSAENQAREELNKIEP